MSVTADRMRELVGSRVRVRLVPAAGGESLEGQVVGCLESDDGLVVYLGAEGGSRRTIHYQHIEAVEVP